MKIDDAVRESLRRRARAVRIDDDAWARLLERSSRPSPDREPSRRRRFAIAVLAVTLAVVPFGVLWWAFRAAPTNQALVSPTSLIAFELYQKSPTSDGGTSAEPQMSIFAIASDGSNLRRLSPDDGAQYGNVTWSPDGTQVAFDRFVRDGAQVHEGIYVMDADGSGLHEIYRSNLKPISVRDLAWSPDGSRIAFVRTVHSDSGSEAEDMLDVFVMNSDGSHLRQVTSGLQITSVAWSPDGDAFVATVQRLEPGGTTFANDVAVLNLEGEIVRTLTDDGGSTEPSWSPDGTQIVFLRNEGRPGDRDSTRDVMVMSRDGGPATALSNVEPGMVAVGPTWSPDGSMVAFSVSAFDKTCSIVVADMSGQPPTQLIGGAELGGCPERLAWQPDAPSTSEKTNSAALMTAAHVADTIPIGRGTSVTYGEGSVWVGVHPLDNAPSILRIDPETAEIVARIPTSVVPSWEVGGGGLLVADGSVWAAGSAGASGGAIVRIDPSTNSVAETIEVPQGSVADVAVNADGIWVLIQGNPDEPEVVRIDPSTHQIVATIPLSGGYGRSIFAGEGWVLAAVTQPSGGGAYGGSLVYVDPATNDAGGVFDLGTYPSVAEGDGAVWAVTETGLVQIDPLSAQPIGGEASVGCTGDALTVGAGGVWCFDPARDRALTRFNPAAGDVDVRLGRDDRTGGLALATSPQAVWVIDGADLVRVDLVAGTVSTSEALPSVGPDGECLFPQMRPTYLPWVATTEAIPAPSTDRFEGYALLSWRAPGGAKEGLTLWRVTTDPYDTDTTSAEEVPVIIGGDKGSLFAGEAGGPNRADWTIMWESGTAECNRLALSLELTGVSMVDGHDLILKVARSLSPR
ncbi:MAG: hypothetical protein M3P18_18305 [Actinomycetota bacterium]|nr:hypothetical protein [Actinomycetota bacterium]